MIKQYFFLIGILTITACNTDTVKIEYGEDQCAACKMIISDARFGAELITKKGRVFKYDAIECMIPEVDTKGLDFFAKILVTDFDDPNKLINAQDAVYLISPSRPSPMGGNLSAYTAYNSTKDTLAVDRDPTITWSELINRY